MNNINENYKDSMIHPFFLYKNMLIELVLRENTKTEISFEKNKKAESQSITFDTIGVQIINPTTNVFCQIDSFKSTCKIVKTGKYKDSHIGLKLKLTTNFNNTGSSGFRDTIINHEAFKYSTNHTIDKNGNDSVIIRGYFIKSRNFLTIFNVAGVKNPSKTLGFSGFSASFLKENFVFNMRVEGVRPLTKKEILICENIYLRTQR